MLVCSATGEYPPITNISLLKNGDMITSAILVNLHWKLTQQTFPHFNHYGLYVCLMNFSGFPLQQSVVLERRGKNIIVNIECRSRIFNGSLSSSQQHSITHETLCVFQINCSYNNSGSCTTRTVSVALKIASFVKCCISKRSQELDKYTDWQVGN